MALLGSANAEVVVVGAGPYGLSIAAHLRQRGIAFRICGVPMQNWRRAMPKGMFLKSEGAGSNLSDPTHGLTLAHHCALTALSYSDQGMPIPLDTFVDYGIAFQRTLVPEVEECTVVALAEKPGAFELQLETGERFTARRVIVAVGTTYFGYLPDPLSNLPRELVSHSRDHTDLGKFANRDVVVIGGGQSALETAALLKEQGANVRVLVRAHSVAWNPSPCAPKVLQRLSRPRSALGLGWKAWFYCHGPGVFQYFPQKLRSKVVQRALGPAGAWWLKDRVIGNLPVLCRHRVGGARETGGRVCLSVDSGDGQKSEIFADHVIAATGYKVDVGALPFLDAGLKRKLRCEGTVPVLSRNFESSVPGLYFTGLASANQFGPSMRFVIGADYTARRIASAIRARASSAFPARRNQWLSSVPND
ncbi:MAG: NAD(P)-binding domain-containing protein [Candidatus Sulfotelmatobacter sp.]